MFGAEIESDAEEDVIDQHDHSKLVKAIGKLDKTQHIQKPTRDVNSAIKSEFHVSHSQSGSDIAIGDIINVLQNSSEHADTSKKIQIAHKYSKALPKPIEKHEAEKIKRVTGFEEVKQNLGKWDAIVTRNRTIEHQKFPLDNEKVEKLKSKEYLSKFSVKSELEKELNELIPEKQDEEEDEGTFPMTMSELLEHRKETARLRAKQSYKEAKARRQKKIKSKKFHRIQRKEKIKLQLKEFEQLQKTDPEEALKRLEQLEKTRAQERVTLRHKSTGQWAKNKLVRAKYDKETRQQLAEQLAISKELTQKQKVEETDSEDDDNNQENVERDSSNPWLSKTQQSNNVEDFVSGYKKYWEERNKSTASKGEDVENSSVNNETSEDKSKNNIQLPNAVDVNICNNKSQITGEVKTKRCSNTEGDVREKNKKRKKVQSTTSWQVEEVSNVSPKGKTVDGERKSVDELFADAEWNLQKNIASKLHLIKSKKEGSNKKIKTSEKEDDYSTTALEFKKKNVRPEINEELDETNKAESSLQIKNDAITRSSFMNGDGSNNVTVGSEIDPNKFAAIKPRHLMSAIPDLETEGDHMDDDEDEKKLTIAEAFEDDDIVAEFQQDKENEVNKDKPKVEDLSMPGWGSWVGKNVKAPKRRRMILKPPETLPRKDDKKDNVIINENKSAKLRAHQVSELPFPFTSVADYEASIRAPIGNTFIPESAHRKHIKPAVIVKRGIVIEPMDESQLIDRKKMSIKKSHNASYDKPLFKKVKPSNK